tara:strand:+ start:147 stop:467 length:321 start_codon:yes stop_codon:yes gene_type:complete
MTFQQENLFGGNGIVEIESRLKEGSFPFSAILLCKLEACGSIGKHRQQRDSELVIGISGQGMITINSKTEELIVKTSVFVPFGAVLSIENKSETEPLEYWIIKVEG